MPQNFCPFVQDEGLTEIYTPPSQTTTAADVVFVHGLSGNPFSTWCYGDGNNKPPNTDVRENRSWPNFWPFRKNPEECHVIDEGDTSGSALAYPKKRKRSQEDEMDLGNLQSSPNKQGCYWPFDLLPVHYKDVRILTYGYDSNPSNFFMGKTNQMNITDHSVNLMLRITDCRIDCNTRPLIFIAHSLGGILVKDAIFQSTFSSNEQQQGLAKSCRAIFFFGTPHSGASAAVWGSYLAELLKSVPVAPSVYVEIIHDLKPNSHILQRITKHFNDILNRRLKDNKTIELCSLQEGQGYSKINAADGKVVSSTSSTFGRSDIEVTRVLNKNHVDMCKFSSQSDPDWQHFKGSMEMFMRDIRKKATIDLQTLDESRQERLQALLDNLDFDGRTSQEIKLQDIQAHDETFEWVWASPLATWLSEKAQANASSPMFWICGKPASGKSTLMDYLRRSQEVHERLSHSCTGSWRIVHHFFNFRARKGIENNLEGLLRSILLQMFSFYMTQIEDPRLKMVIPSSFASSRQQFSVRVLQETLIQRINGEETPTLLILDGLDEYEGDLCDLFRLLEKMKNRRVKICLACRPDPSFIDIIKQSPHLLIEDLNHAGIATYVNMRLRGSFFASGLSERKDIVALSKTFADKAEGVFLWAQFAESELRRSYRQGDSFVTLRRRLDEVPQGLANIYTHILQRLEANQRPEAVRALQLICFARRTLTLTEFLTAMQGLFQTNYDVSLGQFERKILHLTGGLLELFISCETYLLQKDFFEFPDRKLMDDSFEPRHCFNKFRKDPARCSRGKRFIQLVSITHRTVRTYLDSKEWEHALGEQVQVMEHTEAAWLRICTKQFSLRSPIPPNLHRSVRRPCVMTRRRAKDHNSDEEPWITQYRTSNGSNEDDLEGAEFDNTNPLQEYAAMFMLSHAEQVEEVIKLSSYPFMHQGLTYPFLYYHQFLTSFVNNNCKCVLTTSESEGIELGYIYPSEPLHLAIAHNLNLYVRDATAAAGLQDFPQLPRWGIKPTEWDGCEFIGEFESSHYEELTLLEYALHAGQEHGLGPKVVAERHELIVGHILSYTGVVDDAAMMTALQVSTPAVVRLLLQHLPPATMAWTLQGRLRLAGIFQNRKIFHERHLAQATSATVSEDELSFGPLWIISRRSDRCLHLVHDESTTKARQYFLRHGDGVPELIDIFLERGEDINGICGPFGTAAHSVVSSELVRGPVTERLRILMDRGGDLSIKGPFGDILDFLQLVPENSHSDYQEMIRNRIPFWKKMQSCPSMTLEKLKSLEADKKAYKARSISAVQRLINPRSPGDHPEVWENPDEKDDASISDVEIGIVRAEQISAVNHQGQWIATDQRQTDTRRGSQVVMIVMYI